MAPRNALLLRLTSVALVVALLLVGVSTALAKHEPGHAVGLSSTKISDALDPGGPEGNFHFYTFFYPGDRSVATINLQVRPTDVPLLNNVGFHVYDPKGTRVVTSGERPGLEPNESANVIHTLAGWYVVQVFNYDRQRSNTYEIWATGLAAQPTREGAPAAEPAPAAPAPAAPAPAAPAPAAPAPAPSAAPERFTGTLAAGGQAGEFDLYEFTYPGDGSVYTINLQLSPGDARTLDRAGFHVYGPNGNLVVTSGERRTLTPNESANVINRTPGGYTVQVFNYNDYPVDYELWLVTP